MASSVKVLFAGATEGAFEGLFKKVSAANKKVGADLLLCVGSFFASGDPAADPSDYLVSLVTGDTPVPITTFVLGGCGQGSAAILEALPASDCKLRYLGRSGVTQIQGLTIAYLDGSYNAAAYLASASSPHSAPGQPGAPSPYYTAADVAKLKAALQQLTGEVDILLTCEWPRGITQGVPPNLLPEGLGDPVPHTTLGSTIVSEIAALARPRYHIAGGMDCHFARLPYVNKDLGAGARSTRFVSLAPLGSPAKFKSLHALGLVPSDAMTPEQLCAVPDGSTPCPLATTSSSEAPGKRPFTEEPGMTESDWRWSMRQPGGKRGRGRDGRGGGRGGGPGRGAEDYGPPPAVIQGRTDIVRDPYCTVTARNVPWAATEADIIHFFSQAGKVVDVARGAGADGKVNSWLTVQFEARDAAEKALQLHNADFKGRQITVDPATAGRPTPAAALGKPVEGCWFCLGSATVDLSLVTSVGEDAYLVLDKGAITDHHVLVVPIEHYPSSASLPPPAFTELERYLSALRTFFAANGQELVAFERHLALRKTGGNHCHINVVAISQEAAKRAKQAFQSAVQAAGFSLTELPATKPSDAASSAQASLQEAVGSAEYFCAWLPDGTRLVRPIMRGERWPMNLGREVLAGLAGVPGRADWKACAVSTEQEVARMERFKEDFKEYDLTA